MKKLILLLCVWVSGFAVWGQKSIELSDIRMINLGDGRLFATMDDKKKTPIDGKVRIITGYTTEYMNAQFDKGYAAGKWEYYRNNLLAEVKQYADGLMHGEAIEYHADGKTVKSRAVMKNGKPDGLVEGFSPEGKKTYEKNMKEGVDNGYERNYDDDGTLLSETSYKNGKTDGKKFSIANRGRSSETQTTAYYKDGKEDGEYLIVYADGTVKTKGAYKGGEKDGLWESFKRDGKHDGPTEVYENGNVVKRTTYYTDNSVNTETHFNAERKKHGAEKEYAFEGGRLIRDQHYVNGKLVGKQMRRFSGSAGSFFEHAIYDENGLKDGEFTEIWEETEKLRSKGLYVKDKKHGLWLYGYPDGKSPGPEETYENGVRKMRKEYVSNDITGGYFEITNYNERDDKHGEYLETWAKDGKTKTKGLFERGRRHGTWTEYDTDGKLKEETIYDNGSTVKRTKPGN
ncbi:MAG: hypothetical protein LBB84_10015 [Tannerellaceae bacterium]|jgi:antitoxin component YwqK of YwqJK toxin-antitoxin module|nr:hypothetical protein [Tannerellaceae bacterium]